LCTADMVCFKKISRVINSKKAGGIAVF